MEIHLIDKINIFNFEDKSSVIAAYVCLLLLIGDAIKIIKGQDSIILELIKLSIESFAHTLSEVRGGVVQKINFLLAVVLSILCIVILGCFTFKFYETKTADMILISILEGNILVLLGAMIICYKFTRFRR